MAMELQTQQRVLRIGHSPDPDDAFMWYALVDSAASDAARGSDPAAAAGQQPTDPTGAYCPRIDTRGYRFVHLLEDIQSLNDRAEKAQLEVTAISIHQYPFVARDYALTSCGASMGEGYGPMVVVPEGSSIRCPADLLKNGVRLAIPGRRTTAFLALALHLRQAAALEGLDQLRHMVVPFDQIIPGVADGQYDAGLIIHEGQLTYQDAGLACVLDLGRWWTESRGLPLPLGGNAIRRDLADEMAPICEVLLRSIEYGLSHRDEAVAYALSYARDMGRDLADRFVGMYVNHWSLDYELKGRQAVQQLLTEAAQAGYVPDCGPVDFVEPG